MVEVIIALKKEQPEEGVIDIDSGEEEAADKVVKARKKKKKKACDPHKKRACVDCTRRCARIHGGRVSSSSSKARPIPAVPSFFKVMLGYFSDNMEVPPPFAKTMLDLAGSNIYLEDSFGFRWRVRVCLRDGVLSFGHGWNNFVLDHAVSCGEFLVFRQIARSVFTVQMFAPSAVERMYLCEGNKRQSRKRKPIRQEAASSPRTRTVKPSKNNGKRWKKKRRTDVDQNDQVPDRKMSVQVCIDDSDVPDPASELKYSEASEKAPEAGAAEPQEVFNAFTEHQGNVQGVLDGQIEINADNCAIFKENTISDATEIENAECSSLPASVDASGPLAMMDLNGVSIGDIYLSADTYEFESDLCNPESFAVEPNEEGLITDGQSSGFDGLEHNLPNQHSPLEAAQGFVMSEVLPCIENKQMVDALETCNGAANVLARDIEIDVSPAKEQLSLVVVEDKSSPPNDNAVPLSECALSSCSKDKCYGNQTAQKEDSSVRQDKPQDGQVNMQGGTETDNNSGDLQTRSTKSAGVLTFAANKFCIVVPPPGQTWLELPNRLPVIPRTKKQGRKVVILKDPCTRLWPVLYQCTPIFSGFIAGWVDISRENSLQEGDTCEFEFSGKYELSFQVRSSHCCCPAT